MSLLVVGSVALDSIETPSGSADDILGGSATFASAAASLLTPVALVGVVGEDFPLQELGFLRERRVDTSGLAVVPGGKTFRWGGRYGKDLNTRETLFTELGVFATFSPEIPQGFRGSEFVFLGNIDPEIQRRVVEQIRAPKLVAADTMNFWIHGHRASLLETLKRVDVLLVNEEEARDLAGEAALVKAARGIRRMGPRYVVIKRGEHGALLFYEQDGALMAFFAPAYPLEEVKDPTGAGDTFAGGFMGAVCRSGDAGPEGLKRAVVVGSAVASFVVEAFGTERLKTLSYAEVERRLSQFKALTAFDL
jgi:sugar/nucleoside kinase (ribokinase family)